MNWSTLDFVECVGATLSLAASAGDAGATPSLRNGAAAAQLPGENVPGANVISRVALAHN